MKRSTEKCPKKRYPGTKMNKDVYMENCSQNL